MSSLQLVKLIALMERTSGSPEVKIGLVDGPVVARHPDLAGRSIRELSGHQSASCTRAQSVACRHGTYVAGILSARRDSPAPAICPGCTLLVSPIFSETRTGSDAGPSATPGELAVAIVDCITAGARVINLSLGLAPPATVGERALQEALQEAVRHGVLVVAAAGNQGALASSAITRHPWVIPVVACEEDGRPVRASNLGASIGHRGLRAPGDRITSLSPDGRYVTAGGTSAAVPFVTGTIALLWSEFPTAAATQIRLALLQPAPGRRASVVPPLLDAAAAYRYLATSSANRSAR